MADGDAGNVGDRVVRADAESAHHYSEFPGPGRTLLHAGTLRPHDPRRVNGRALVLLLVADQIRLAEAVPGDEHAIADLYATIDEFYGTTRREDPRNRAERARAALFDDPPAGRALLAWDDATLAGFAGYQLIWPSIAMTTSLYLKELFVRAGYRGAGLGRLLMAGLRDVAVARGCTRIEWTTDTGNLSAQRFYESLGTAPMGSKLFYRDVRGLPQP